MISKLDWMLQRFYQVAESNGADTGQFPDQCSGNPNEPGFKVMLGLPVFRNSSLAFMIGIEQL